MINQFFFISDREDVANHVESKSADDCESHYNSYFIFGNIGKGKIDT